MSDDLVAFLRARLDEDEQTARAALPGPWEVSYHYDAFGDVGPDWTVVALHTAPASAESTGEDPAHIARWDPARVLAEVEAKRLIVKEHEDEMVDPCATMRYPCPTLKMLAQPYADHPQFHPSWLLRASI